MIKQLISAFIPIFVAVDALGLLPIFISLTTSLNQKEKTKVIVQSITTALILAVAFLFLCRFIFRFLGVSIGDFMIAGGVVLFCIAIIDMVSPQDKNKFFSEDVGVVPLGTPLIVGPAVLTTSLIVMENYGVIITLISILFNILIVGLVFLLAKKLIKLFGKSGIKAFSKITSLLLAAIAIMVIRKGLLYIFQKI
ncbi:MAG: MarC family protein [Candidatus Aenigmatarchaeota archaeon]